VLSTYLASQINDARLKGVITMLTSTFCLRGFSVFSICFWLFAINTQAQTRAYVTNPGGSVTVIDVNTSTVVTKIPVCSDSCFPTIPAVTPNGARVYVTNSFHNTVTVIDTLTNTVIDTITVGQSPSGIAITPDGTRAYVASRNRTISVIDTSTNTVIATIAANGDPLAVAITPDGTRAYVSNTTGSVSVVDTGTNTIITNILILDFPFGVPAGSLTGMVITPDGTRVYVASYSFGKVYVISTLFNAVLKAIPTDFGSLSIAISPNGARVYTATDFFSAHIMVIDTASNTVIDKISVGGPPPFVAVTPDGTRLYIIANTGESKVDVFDTSTNSLVTTIPTGDGMYGVAFGILPPVPHTKDDCKNGGYQQFTVLGFPNQGQCLQYVKEHAN
jgi:YVTN family beta-propeller protein